MRLQKCDSDEQESKICLHNCEQDLLSCSFFDRIEMYRGARQQPPHCKIEWLHFTFSHFLPFVTPRSEEIF